MKYQHLFFDLDHTLWDFERNSAESLTELYENFELSQHGIASVHDFIKTFSVVNFRLWDDFDHGRIAHAYIRENRFRLVFEALGVEKIGFDGDLGEEYLRLLPQKKHLLAGAKELLEYTAQEGYRLHIVSNGFDFIQARKMESAGILHFFDEIITNDKAGAKKPDPQIFAFALSSAKAQSEHSLMIGDNWVADIQGAMRFGIDAAFYNPNGLSFEQSPTYNIQHLNELMTIL
ncbi:MAG: YjjG family noncanonical pyrimidine nucleotidase [Runella sp.]